MIFVYLFVLIVRTQDLAILNKKLIVDTSQITVRPLCCDFTLVLCQDISVTPCLVRIPEHDTPLAHPNGHLSLGGEQ